MVDAKYDCLISYNHKDETDVRRVIDHLKENGIRCWVDRDEVGLGQSWQDCVQAAFPESRCVLIFFGSSGFGPLQIVEWRYLATRCTEEKKTFIPVLLPGGEIPKDDFYLKAANPNPVNLQNGLDNQEALNALVHELESLRPKRIDGEYTLLTPMNRCNPRCCCVAVPFGGDRELFEVLQDAARDANLGTVQTFDATLSETFQADPFEAICHCSILLADGTIDSQTGQLDANVALQIGMAKSLRKPVVLVTNKPLKPVALFKTGASNIIDFDLDAFRADGFNMAGRLREEVLQAINDCLAELRDPWLIKEHDEKVNLVWAELLKMRPIVQSNLHEVLRFGLEIHNVFSEVALAVQELHRTVEVLDTDRITNGKCTHAPRDLNQFKEARIAFHAIQIDTVTPLLELAENSPLSIDSAFQKMKSRTEVSSISRKLIEESFGYFTILKRILKDYNTSAETLIPESELPKSLDGNFVTFTKMHVDALTRNVYQVKLHTFRMSKCLLELNGQKGLFEGASHAKDRTTHSTNGSSADRSDTQPSGTRSSSPDQQA